jgi:murein DD-endopeptidase MepM/ murein hydrolase activator NlpD
MKRPFGSRLFLLAVVVWLTAGWVTALAETAVQHHEQERKRAGRQLHRLRVTHRRAVGRLHGDRLHARELLDAGGRGNLERRSGIRDWGARQIRITERLTAHENRDFKRRLARLVRTRETHAAWLTTYAVFERCPVPGSSFIHDDFGEMVRMEGVPLHVHMGSDIQAPYGSRIVAPFDGRAVGSASELGGLEVRVYGAGGYVYNAHLAWFGTLGSVQAGDTIGYVGSTGNSTAPHDHIEWHPGDGGAVDPYLYLALSCLG